MNDTIKELTKRVIDIRDARDWKQFHNPKDVALSLVLEATDDMTKVSLQEYDKKLENLDRNLVRTFYVEEAAFLATKLIEKTQH